MASFETNSTSTFSVGGFFSRLGDIFVGAFSAVSAANVRVAQIEALQGLSDEQLAAKGLRREDIARYVFRDMSYI